MNRHTDMFERLRRRTGMWVYDESYWAVVNFLLGYDTAMDGGALRGFREWLILRGARTGPLGWPDLVLMFAGGSVAEPREGLTDTAAHRRAIDTLFDLLAEFEEVTRDRDGLAAIYVALDRRGRRGLELPRQSAATTPGALAVAQLLRSHGEVPFPPTWFPARVREIVSRETIDDVMAALPDDVRELVVAWVQQTYASEPTRRRGGLTEEQVDREHLLVAWVREQGRLQWPRERLEADLRAIEQRLACPDPVLVAMRREPQRILTYAHPAIVDAVMEYLPDDIRAAVIVWIETVLVTDQPRPWPSFRGAAEALVEWAKRAHAVRT